MLFSYKIILHLVLINRVNIFKRKLGGFCLNFSKWCIKLGNSISIALHKFLFKSVTVLHLPDWSLVSVMQLSANEDEWFWNINQLFIWFPLLRYLFQYQNATIFLFRMRLASGPSLKYIYIKWIGIHVVHKALLPRRHDTFTREWFSVSPKRMSIILKYALFIHPVSGHNWCILISPWL